MFRLSYPESGNFFYATKNSVGFDISSNEDITIPPGESYSVSTGLYILDTYYNSAFPNTIPELQIRCRSGLAAKHNIVVIGGVLTVDPDYRHEIKVPLINQSKRSYKINKGDRIAQGVCAMTYQIECIEIKDQIRQGGFGSTGK